MTSSATIERDDIQAQGAAPAVAIEMPANDEPIQPLGRRMVDSQAFDDVAMRWFAECADCTQGEAIAIVDYFVRHIVPRIIDDNWTPIIMGQTSRDRHHRVVKKLIPDGFRSAPSTPHRMLEQLFTPLMPEGTRLQLSHGKTGAQLQTCCFFVEKIPAI